MKTSNLYLMSYLVLSCTFISCGQNPTPATWIQANTYELFEKETYDFSPFAEILKDKKIVAIGESSHGLGAFYNLKSELVQYLHQELNYEVIAIEGGLGDINLAWSHVDTFSAKTLRDNTLFGNFRAAEVFGLFEYLEKNSSTEKPLIYTGFDSQMSSQYFSNQVKNILFPYDHTLSDSLTNYFGSYSKWYQAGMRQDASDYLKHQQIFINAANAASKILSKNETAIRNDYSLSVFQYQIIQKTLEGLARSVDLPYEERYKGLELRDQIMFENLSWLIDTIYPNKKIIIWAHNGHIENAGSTGNNIKWMGHHLKEKYKDDYYALGLFAYKGEVYQHWTKKIIPFENKDRTSIEHIMMQSNKKMAFLDLEQQQNNLNDWLFKECKGFELENGGIISFIPKNRFDGIITIFESDAPTY